MIDRVRPVSYTQLTFEREEIHFSCLCICEGGSEKADGAKLTINVLCFGLNRGKGNRTDRAHTPDVKSRWNNVAAGYWRGNTKAVLACPPCLV